jgi:hypothetical protein
MLLQKSDELLLALQEELNGISVQHGNMSLSRMTASMVAVRKALMKLKALLKETPFPDFSSEIYFFKNVKPKFYSLQIYYAKLFNLDNSKPCGTIEDLINHYKLELNVIERYYRNNRFMYEYYRLGMDEMDKMYFIRGAEIQTILLPNIPEMNADFATSCDYLFSKFRAYEMLSGELLNRIDQLKGHPNSMEEQKPELKWTGDKVNLVEVIYALHFTGQLNNGNADISAIIRFMEKHLQIDLSRAYRDFTDIRNRKSTSPTRYIDQMRESIHKRMDDDLALKKENINRYKSNS